MNQQDPLVKLLRHLEKFGFVSEPEIEVDPSILTIFDEVLKQ